jgi:serine/threonine protein kinase
VSAAHLSRAGLSAATEAVLHRGGWGNPDVLLVRHTGGRVVVKDYAPRSRWVRATLGRWLVAREARAYDQLRGAPGVPKLLGRLDGLALVIEYRPGQRLSRQLAADLPAGFMRELERRVEAMHGRGVVHLDLRHRGNVLAGDDGEPILLDFASAVRLPTGRAPGRWLLSGLARIDRRALDKWRVRLQPAPGRTPG